MDDTLQNHMDQLLLWVHKEKENKGRHGHHFVAVSVSNSTSCDVCSKSMANKSALRCENCSINVHENSCKEQSPICDKHRQNIRVPQRSQETGSMTNLHTQDKQLTTASEYTLPAHISWSVVHSVISELSPFVSSKPRQWNLRAISPCP
uniref:Phorbol-ester/DAG-type domain-containing protein n=1 Tax=Magallana gigas TaxID=29159 RepID=A0A8W8HLR4_MAGGI|nr:uncharacterized protein LOC117688750 isoform X2 [Crassostrea gigas]